MTITKILPILAAFLLSGCVMHPQVKLAGPQPVAGHTLTLVDSRPDARKKTELLSSIITDCDYGIARLGDSHTQPDRVAYLSQRLLAVKSDALAGKRVLLKDFGVYRNNQVKLRGGVMPNATGVTIAMLRMAECFGDRNVEGGYDPAENPSGDNLAIVNIEIAIDGRALNARALVPAKGTPAQFPAAHDIWSQAIAGAIDLAIDRLAEQL